MTARAPLQLFLNRKRDADNVRRLMAPVIRAVPSDRALEILRQHKKWAMKAFCNVESSSFLAWPSTVRIDLPSNLEAGQCRSGWYNPKSGSWGLR